MTVIGSTAADRAGPVAVVTGASRGLGRAIARHLGAAGFAVVVGYRTGEEEAVSLVAEIVASGSTGRAVAGDVVDPATADALVLTAAELGRLAVWVNNAGVSVLAPVVDTTGEQMAHMVDVNLMGTFHGTRAAAAAMIGAGGGGRIVNIASEAGVQAFPLLGGYSATKFAVVGLSQAAALELGAHGITVNAICPGTAETDMVLAERESEVSISGLTPDEVRSSYLAAIPVGRFCSPDDVGALVAFVAGPGGAYITGQSLCTNGGSVLH